ncbi:hypothetical protein HYU07_07900 [Candidatus Woesearchaeota archaeon]|nr:hypothetical protein [Candidatus Woesearchaeota archaeon]
MNPLSINSYIFSTLGVKFCAPSFLKSEFEEHKLDCLLKSGLSEYEFEIRQKEIEEKIEFIDFPEYKGFLKAAKNSLPDSDDEPYVALALSIKAAIWSNDPHLKMQSLVKVYTTEELIDELLKS